VSMLSENAVTFDRIAYSTNLFSHFVRIGEHFVECDRDLVVLIGLLKVELNGTWVSVAIIDSAIHRLILMLLKSFGFQFDILTWDN